MTDFNQNDDVHNIWTMHANHPVLGPLADRELYATLPNARHARVPATGNTQQFKKFARQAGLTSLSAGQSLSGRRELTFDVDLSDYGAVRTNCPCGAEKIMCSQCWNFARCAVRVIDCLAREILGAKKIAHFFSGRRGTHTYIVDEEYQKTPIQSRQILWQLFAEESNSSSAEIVRLCRHYYALYYHKQALDDKEAVRCMYPRVDGAVFNQPKHVLRVPLTPHPVTGRIVWPLELDDLEAFSYLRVPTLTQLHGDCGDARARYEAACARTREKFR